MNPSLVMITDATARRQQGVTRGRGAKTMMHPEPLSDPILTEYPTWPSGDLTAVNGTLSHVTKYVQELGWSFITLTAVDTKFNSLTHSVTHLLRRPRSAPLRHTSWISWISWEAAWTTRNSMHQHCGRQIKVLMIRVRVRVRVSRDRHRSSSDEHQNTVGLGWWDS